MIAGNLISNSIIPLKTSDTGQEALGIMREFGVSHLPIVNNKQFLGLLSEEDIISNNIEEAIGSYRLSLNHPQVREHDHIYEIMRLLGEHYLTMVAVVDSEENYIGLITLEDLLQYFANQGSFTEPGSIVVLEVAKRDYSMSEIAQIVESERAIILSSLINSNIDNSVVEVTLKINRQEIQNIVASFQRYNYVIKGTYYESDYGESLKDRYNALIAYLNV